MKELNEIGVPLDNLYLDPNNFRFREPGHFSPVKDERVVEQLVQDNILDIIRNHEVRELKESIKKNGFIRVERIVVRKLDGGDADLENKYIVLEGNRRVAALKILRAEHLAGAEIREPLIRTFDSVPVLEAVDPDSEDVLSIMGIRHVGGPKEWGGYQSARLVFEMCSKDGVIASDVAARLGLSTREVNRRRDAYAALRQMEEHDEFEEYVASEMYPLFHEALGKKQVKEWLEWDRVSSKFNNIENLELFYGLITSDDDQSPQISSYQQVRKLGDIVESQEALAELVSGSGLYEDAEAIVNQEVRSKRWFSNAKVTSRSIMDLTLEDIEELSDLELEELEKLRHTVAKVIRTSRAAKQKDGDDDF